MQILRDEPQDPNNRVLKIKMVAFDTLLGVHKTFEIVDSYNRFLIGRHFQVSAANKKVYIYFSQKKRPKPEDVYSTMEDFLKSIDHDDYETIRNQ